MQRSRRLLLCGGAALLLAIICAALVAGGVPSAKRSAGSLAVVLLPDLAGSRLAVVDPASRAVVRTVRLRSLVTDMDVDRESGIVVAAQSGGVGDQADDAVSLLQPRTGAVRYVRLPWRDPVQVECIGGRAYVLHSIVETAGLAVSVVDVGSGSVVATGHAPDGPGVWTMANGRLWTVSLSGDGGLSLARLDPRTLQATTVPTPELLPCGVAETSAGVAVLGAAAGGRAAGVARVLLLSGTGAPATGLAVPGLQGPARIAAAVVGRLVMGDWSGETPESRRLAVADTNDLSRSVTIPVDGVPCAIAGLDGRVLVVDRMGGRLLRIDPVNGATESSVDLGERDLIYSQVVVVPPESDAQ
jgi:hypothetical protein